MTIQLKLKVLFLTVIGAAMLAHAQGTAFTYNGRISEIGGGAVNGNYEFNFSVYDVAANGVPVAGPLAVTPVPVANGLFTAVVDFGPGIFTGPPRFLAISVRPVGGGNFQLLSPRQQLTASPYAVHAASAGTAAGVSNGAVVKSLNNLKDNVTLAAGANVTITPGGNTLTIASVGGGGAGIWSVLNNNAYYTAGNVALGTNTPTPGVRLEVNGPIRVTPGGSGGYISIAAPNGETGLGAIGVNRFDLRFDGTTLKLAAGPGTGPPGPANGITLNTNGNVGVGMASPLIASQWKLEVNGPVRLTPGGSGGAVQFSAPNGESGMGIIGVNRADLRFDGSTLKLLAGAGVGPPSSANGIAINTSGNVGIGTTTPVAKLHAETSQANTAAVYGHAAGANGAGVYGQSTTGPAIHAQGNATQAQDKGGFVKAMIYINAAGAIQRCYNGVTGSATGGCGFTVNSPIGGVYQIDFGFPVSNRFVSVTPERNFGDSQVSDNRGVNYRFADFSDRVIEVFTFDTDDPDDTSQGRFMIILY